LNAGFPAVRLSVAVEDYDHQHQDLRTENGTVYGDTIDEMDFPYLRKVTALNVAALAALARAPAVPEPMVQGAVATFTSVRWRQVEAADSYVVRWRRTDAAQWQHSQRVSADCREISVTNSPRVPNAERGDNICLARLPGVRVDDWVFGVSSIAADGSESPVASAVPGGAFRPHTPPPAQQ